MAIDKAVDSAVLDGYFYAISDAINYKRGDGVYIEMTPGEMPQAIENLPSGGGLDPDLEALMRGDASGDIEITLPAECHGMVFYIDESSRPMQNSGVISLTINGAENFGSIGLQTGGLIMGPAQIEALIMPDMETIQISRRSSSIYPFQNLATFDAPELTQLSANAGYLFIDSQLTEFICPKLTLLGSYMFDGSTSLELVDVAPRIKVEERAFYGCSSLKALVLRHTSAITLRNVDALTGTPIASGTGYIYVPDALKTTYQAATNWSTYSAQFRSLEDYTDDGTITGKFIMPEY